MGTLVVRVKAKDGSEFIDCYNDTNWPMAAAMSDWLGYGETMEILAYYPTIESQRTEGGRFLYERCASNIQKAINKWDI